MCIRDRACTFKGAKRAAKAIAALPLERIVLETDCPYMALSLIHI